MDTSDGRRARGTSRRQLLLEAAVRVVAASGSGSLTHRAVAAEAAVSVASATYHYPSISELRRETFRHAGSSIGAELGALILAASARIEETPEICAGYAERLLTEHRVETAAVFELIVASAHDDELRPVVAAHQGMLAELLLPYTGVATRARATGAALQGLLLVQLASPSSFDPAAFGSVVADLVRRQRDEN